MTADDLNLKTFTAEAKDDIWADYVQYFFNKILPKMSTLYHETWIRNFMIMQQKYAFNNTKEPKLKIKYFECEAIFKY